ncbi:MAG TPA: FeoA family protein [Steroidobacteraceae bacterium]|nr:FeoA family protein [Steroidobacteraceae bacterium]
MDAAATSATAALEPGAVSLAALRPGTRGRVVRLDTPCRALSALERRLLEFGFVSGERVEILAEARPGRDPFVVRIGHTTLALRRREAESVLVEVEQCGSRVSPAGSHDPPSQRVELARA